jgi:hypothetical protein
VDWAVVGVLVTVGWPTGWLRSAYGWLPHMRADASQAWAAWATFAIAAVAAVFAYNQVKVARQTREEQAQPNVVIYVESTPSHWQFLDVVLKNFGTTPAYNVTVEITPELKQSPDHAGGEITKVPFPELTRTLAPGQEIRTNWDFAVAREDYMRKLSDLYDRKQLTRSEFRERELRSRHEAIVRYEDSHHNKYEMRSTLDFDLLRDTMRVDTYTPRSDQTNREATEGIRDDREAAPELFARAQRHLDLPVRCRRRTAILGRLRATIARAKSDAQSTHSRGPVQKHR